MADHFKAPVVVGIVVHCDIGRLPQIKEYFENLDGIRVITIKTSSEKLWIKEGNTHE